MRFDDGLRTYRFYWASSVGSQEPVLRFRTADEALSLLIRIWDRYGDFPLTARSWLARRMPVTCWRLTDLEVLQATALCMLSRELVVSYRDKEKLRGFAAAAPQQPAFVPFPLQRQRPQPAPAQAPPQDPATFSSDLDVRSQAAALVAAAQSGAPFCPE